MAQLGSAKIHKSHENTGKKNLKSNFFRTLEINQEFPYLGEMAGYEYWQRVLWDLNLPYFHFILPSFVVILETDWLTVTVALEKHQPTSH